MKIIVNNLAVEYEDTAEVVKDGSPDSGTESMGNGPVMLLLHGWMETLRTFDALVPALTEHWRVIRLDLPGFGGSELPPKPWGTEDYASFVADFYGKLNIDPEILIGHSFGGRIILKGVSEGVFSPKKLVLVASAGLATYRTLRAMLFLLAAKAGKIALFFLPRATRERLRLKLYGAAGSSDYLTVNSGVLKETFLKAIREDLSESAKAIHIPTLLVWGEHDIITPLADGKRLARLISGSKLEIIAGAGHFVHQERPEKVAELIRKFL